ncbi:unnamed protein product [Tenebrio molitor]|nr:unnamed protein product [Tenebrio molitor]
MADVENQTASSVTTGSAATPQSHAKKEKKRRIPGRNRPILRHPRWSTTPSRDSRNAEDRLFRPSKVRRRKLQSRRRKVAPFIKKYLKGAVASGSLVQTKGKGASGSFKLASSTSGGAKKTAAEKKSAAAASAAAAKAKKSAASSAEKKTRAAPKPRSPSKAKKSNKAGPTKNPKHPNPRQPKPFLSR